MLEQYTQVLFRKGTEMADSMGLILVDTKYEFGKVDGRICLIDEIHTPDSSRYFYKEGYQERQQRGEAQKQLSKEFVREWLMEQGFNGAEGQQAPHMPEEFVSQVSERYMELFEKITGEKFIQTPSEDVLKRIEENCLRFLEQNK
jgi:phosphoribosylaminoimidazole-succinocarboxamide synthase